MSQPSIHNIQTKNLDKYLDNSIESISSDYERPPPPPPNDYYDQHSYKKKKSKHHHEPLPNIQILGHTAPPTKTIKSSSKTTTRKKKKKKTSKQSNRSITPPPPNNNTTDQLDLSTSTTRSASPPNKNGYSHHKNGHSHRYNHSPPLTSNIAKIEQQLQTYPLTGNGHIINGTNINNMHEKPHRANVNKVKKILGVEASFDFNDTPQNRKKKLDSISHSICSIESLDADDGTGFNPRETRRILLNEIHNDNMNTTSGSSDSDSETMSVESVKDKDEITKCKPKIRMWNALAYGLEDLIEGKTFEWVDSKYVRLLQLSTYSTVMGPKVKFVWKNSEIYNIQSLNIQSNDNDDYKEEIRKVRPEFAYHELEAWIAKQTLDCTGWKNKHNKTAPPPFTKKTMIAPEFGVVLCCIQFDSSLRALRNKQFNQYINGIYTHNNVHTPANVGHHINSNGNGRHVPHTPKSARTYSPDKNGNNRRGFGYKHGGGGGGGVAPTLSPYDHTGVTDDSSPNHQIPSSYSQKSYSSRYSSPPSGYRPVGDTLADYLSKFAPFSFSAGLSGGMNVSGANIPQVPYNRAMQNRDNNNSMGGIGIGGDGNNGIINGQGYINNSLSNIHHIDENEDPDDIGHYSLVLAVEYKYYEKFIESLDAIEHWLYMIASQIRYLLVLNKCFKCDQMQHSLHTDFNAFNNNEEEDNISSIDDEDDTDRLHTIIPFITNIAPTAIFKFDQLFSATFVGSTKNTHSHSHSDKCQIEDDISLSMSSSYLINDMCINYIPSRGLPEKISLFDTYFTCPLDNRDKHKLSIMISSHLQTLGRTLIIGNNENEIDRYISTLALFSTSQQKSLSRLSVKVDNTNNLSTHYIPELYLQGIVIPTIKSNINMNNININNSISDKDSKSNSNKSINSIDNDYAATVSYLQSSPAMKKLQQDLYLAPGPSTLVLLTSSNKVHNNNNNNSAEDKQSFWWIRQTAMPHKFKQEQQSMLFEKLFYLRRRPRRRNSSSYIYGRKRSANLFDSPPHKNKQQQQQQQQNGNPYLTPPHDNNNNNNNNNHERTLERKNERMKENNHSSFDKSLEFKSMNKIYHSKKALNEDYEHNGDTIDLVDEISDRQDDNESVTNTSIQSNNISINNNNNNNNNNKELTFVEPSLSPMIATVVFGSFNIPQELKMTFLETQFRILLEKASEILLYIEHEQKDLLQFYDKTCHVMSCKEFKEQVPMEALYPQIMQKFESQLRSDLQISRQEDLYVLLSISEGFRPNLFSLMFGNPVFDIEVADILRYFLF